MRGGRRAGVEAQRPRSRRVHSGKRLPDLTRSSGYSGEWLSDLESILEIEDRTC